MGAARICATTNKQGDAETLQVEGQGQHARISTRNKQDITVSANICDEDLRFDTRQSRKVGRWDECCCCFVDLADGILVLVEYSRPVPSRCASILQPTYVAYAAQPSIVGLYKFLCQILSRCTWGVSHTPVSRYPVSV